MYFGFASIIIDLIYFETLRNNEILKTLPIHQCSIIRILLNF